MSSPQLFRHRLALSFRTHAPVRTGVAVRHKVSGREPLLFTPGPLTTSPAVKQAMLVDYGSRDQLFLNAVVGVRQGLLRAAGTSQQRGHECVIVQGAGTMGVEAMLGTAVPRNGGKVLIAINGAYGHRQVTICKYLGIDHEFVEFPDADPIDIEVVRQKLLADKAKSFTHVSVIHHETTAGVINPLEALAKTLRSEFPNVSLLVDSMSGFGAYDLQMDWGIDFAVSSANKCIEGVPGFCFALCNRAALERTKGNARSLSLDLYDQWQNIEKTGQFRFTPPTHAILAFHQALIEWEAEGGVAGRAERYRANYEVMRKEMEEMGFKFYVPEPHRSFLISTFVQPNDPKFDFQTFYDNLQKQGFVIYPGKLAKGASFRFGSIGRLFPHDFELLVSSVRNICGTMGVQIPVKY